MWCKCYLTNAPKKGHSPQFVTRTVLHESHLLTSVIHHTTKTIVLLLPPMHFQTECFPICSSQQTHTGTNTVGNPSFSAVIGWHDNISQAGMTTACCLLLHMLNNQMMTDKIMTDNLVLMIKFTLQAGAALSIKLKSQTSSGL